MLGKSITKIMIVDDEADIATAFKRGLESYGFEVDAFTDPEEALREYQPGRYDILITDVRMPGITGFELYRQIRKVDDKTKVAFMTAFEIYREEFGRIFPDLDVKCFITKPISISNLVTKVTDELQGTRVSDSA